MNRWLHSGRASSGRSATTTQANSGKAIDARSGSAGTHARQGQRRAHPVGNLPAAAEFDSAISSSRRAPIRSNNRATWCGGRRGRARSIAAVHTADRKADRRAGDEIVERSPAAPPTRPGRGRSEAAARRSGRESRNPGYQPFCDDDRQAGEQARGEQPMQPAHRRAPATGPWPIRRLELSAARTIRAPRRAAGAVGSPPAARRRARRSRSWSSPGRRSALRSRRRRQAGSPARPAPAADTGRRFPK